MAAPIFVRALFAKPWRRRIFDDKLASGELAPMTEANSVDYDAGQRYSVKLDVAIEAIALGFAEALHVCEGASPRDARDAEKLLANAKDARDAMLNPSAEPAPPLEPAPIVDAAVVAIDHQPEG